MDLYERVLYFGATVEKQLASLAKAAGVNTQQLVSLAKAAETNAGQQLLGVILEPIYPFSEGERQGCPALTGN